MSDFLKECNSGELQTDGKSFQEVWCSRCRRRECDLARWRTDRFETRVSDQPRRFFEPNSADITLPKFARIAAVDFPDLLRKAMRLEVSERRGDWSVPEIPIMDGCLHTEDESVTRHVDEAVRKLGRQTEIDDSDEYEPEEPGDFVTEGEPYDSDTVSEPEPCRSVTPVSVPEDTRRPAVLTVPTKGNIDGPSEMMVDDRPAREPVEKPDPWSVPTTKPALKTKPGARIRFGLTGQAEIE